ncbi:phosphoserine phosphatase SerB [Labrys monachus]|uniref:Phosphoserine phosphatase n=1 Tax=Labrys monachus TaxID=217067 RepID=A0ABU0FKT8_9HYPH|nr:phosphoserine phosphatase SerB [Labrys monachus]MDQ0395228.1 phosphoserine phosphatase [Labrys monachus]
MSLVATLITHPARPALNEEVLARARAALLAPQGATVLAPGIAVDIPFTADAAPETIDAKLIEARLREALDGLPIDLVVQEAAGRRKHLFLADMDSTMIGQECIDELADFVGAKARVAEITERAMRGEIAFEPALRERVALLEGLPEAVVDEVVRSRLTLTTGGPDLVRTMRANGAHTALVSGGFTLFTARIAAMLGFDEHHANILLTKDGVLTGKVAEPILGREAKLANLRRLRQAGGLAVSDTLAVGDGANDLAMLGEAGLGVAFHAKPAVAAAARMRIDHGDLTALLYAQGYGIDRFHPGG